MCTHEEKTCPRCSTPFECKAGSITACQCYGISFTEDERLFIAERYSDCLCRKCLFELKNRYTFFKEKLFWK